MRRLVPPGAPRSTLNVNQVFGGTAVKVECSEKICVKEARHDGESRETEQDAERIGSG